MDDLYEFYSNMSHTCLWYLLTRAGVYNILVRSSLVAKVKDSGLIGYDGSTDPGYAQLLVQKATGVKKTSPGHFAGTIDLT